MFKALALCSDGLPTFRQQSTAFVVVGLICKMERIANVSNSLGENTRYSAYVVAIKTQKRTKLTTYQYQCKVNKFMHTSV